MSARPRLRVLVVDDEPPARDRLERLLDELPDCERVGAAENGRGALEAVERLRPDVVLLDIRMPDMDGLECARRLGTLEAPPAIVFTTAYDQYALEAFDAQAAAYLLKPVRREKLEAALEKATRLTRPQLARLAPVAPRRTHFSVRVRDQIRLVPVEDVLACVADQKYVTLHHRAGGELADDLVEDSLRSIEDELAAEFVRVHRNALVAVRHVESLERDLEGRCRVRLRGSPLVLDVSRRLAGEVQRRLRG